MVCSKSLFPISSIGLLVIMILKEENAGLHTTLEEVKVDVAAGQGLIRSFRQRIASGEQEVVDIENEISTLEHMFENFETKATKHKRKKNECVKPKVVIKAR